MTQYAKEFATLYPTAKITGSYLICRDKDELFPVLQKYFPPVLGVFSHEFPPKDLFRNVFKKDAEYVMCYCDDISSLPQSFAWLSDALTYSVRHRNICLLAGCQSLTYSSKHEFLTARLNFNAYLFFKQNSVATVKRNGKLIFGTDLLHEIFRIVEQLVDSGKQYPYVLFQNTPVEPYNRVRTGFFHDDNKFCFSVENVS